MTGAIALATIGHGIVDLGASYRKGLEDKGARHQDRMTHLERQLERQERQERQDLLVRQERQEAMIRAQELESDLSDDSLAALLEVFQDDEGSAMAYLSIKTESVRKAWVKRKIARATQMPPDPL